MPNVKELYERSELLVYNLLAISIGRAPSGEFCFSMGPAKIVNQDAFDAAIVATDIRRELYKRKEEL